MKNRAWTGLGSAAVCCTLVAMSPDATAQTLPNYGFEWATITHPGNRNANALEAPWFHPPISNPAFKVGRVDYEYRIATTQVTVEQWFEFVNAYYPFHPDPLYGRIQGAFTGNWIFARNRNLSQPPEFFMEQGSERYATDMSWRYAARYVNWLHNGKVNEKWAFENGVYDTSTFITNDNGSFNDQLTHHPNARVWIPTMNEWIKANHYDPDRYGPGEEGYWHYNSSSEVELFGALPGTPGAQTDAGRWGNLFTHYPVDSYPETQSPWGLLAASGGTREWSELVSITLEGPKRRAVFGSRRWAPLSWDRIDTLGFSPPGSFSFTGLRIASVVPSPATFVVLGSASLFLVSRRRRKLNAPAALGLAAALSLLTITPYAAAQAPPNYGYEWATITHPGNRNANAMEAPRFHAPLNPEYKVGRVDHVYRIAKGQVTVGQWFEFVRAYYPHMDDPRYTRISGEFTGNWVFATNRNPSQPPGWIIEPGSEKYETDMGWRFAARYANWLHNGKVNEKWAFENGAYDTSTFTTNANGSFNDQQEHHPDAKFWIPSMSELIKANHYDPDRYGPGEEGYWRYNSTSNVRLIGGPPGSPGAQTDNGFWGDPFQHYPFDAYPDTVSPWGLLGASGGTKQWTEGVEFLSAGPVNRRVRGTNRYFSLSFDNLDRFAFRNPQSFSFIGLRLASAVPGPATFALLGTASLFLVSRRRRK